MRKTCNHKDVDRCAWCERPLCEDFVTGTLMTDDSDTHCTGSADGKHHTGLPAGEADEEGRRDFILRMARLADDEPEEFSGGSDLVTRTLQYAGTARPRVTRAEVEDVLRRM